MFHSNRIYLTVDHVFHQRNVRILIFRTEGSAVALVLWLLCGRGKIVYPSPFANQTFIRIRQKWNYNYFRHFEG